MKPQPIDTPKVTLSNAIVASSEKQSMPPQVDDIERFLQNGSKIWRSSKIMIVGEGRAGKTAFSNSIAGKQFTDTESTIGIRQFTCDVTYANVGKGQWTPCDRPERELELAIAEGLANHASGDDDSSRLEDMCSILQSEQHSAPQGKDVGPAAQRDPLPTGAKKKTVEQHLVNQAATKPEASSQLNSAATQRSFVIDNDLVAKCLSKSLQNGKNLNISVFDYGGQSVFNAIHSIFLTKYGVYTIVFSMERLLQNELEKQSCLSHIRFWANSIVSHTYSHV